MKMHINNMDIKHECTWHFHGELSLACHPSFKFIAKGYAMFVQGDWQDNLNITSILNKRSAWETNASRQNTVNWFLSSFKSVNKQHIFTNTRKSFNGTSHPNTQKKWPQLQQYGDKNISMKWIKNGTKRKISLTF